MIVVVVCFLLLLVMCVADVCVLSLCAFVGWLCLLLFVANAAVACVCGCCCLLLCVSAAGVVSGLGFGVCARWWCGV